MTLTTDERWLLAVYDPSMLADLILTPEYGLSRIKSACAGGTGYHPNKPEWLRGYGTGNGGIHTDDGHASITYGRLVKWASDVPAEIRAKLEANRTERVAEQERVSLWCMCGRGDECRRVNAGDPLYGDRYHPSDAEWNQHVTNGLRTRSYLKVYIGQAIWREEPAQLDLFAESGSAL